MSRREINLSGARTLVVGGSGVLGGLIAAELRTRGSTVMLAGRNTQRLHAAATNLGPGVPSVVFDLAVPGHADHVVDTTVHTLGGIDGVINAAGVVAFGPFAELEDATLEALVATNFTGPLRVIRRALPHMDGGFVVNITGVVAEQPAAGLAAYSAVKAGLSAASQALGRELRRSGVHVMDARPPHTETGLAGRSIAGTAPQFPQGLAAAAVASTIVAGLAAGRRELPATDFISAAA
jgi:cyclic-di-GMP-binding biofilm dispersal mediator protein